MRSFTYFSILTSLLLITYSCGSKTDEKAVGYFDSIKIAFEKGEFDSALSMADSIEARFPKAFDQIKEALVLKQEIRKAINQERIVTCDSLIAVNQTKIDSLKSLFLEQKRDDFRDKAVFIPKTVAIDIPAGMMLRSGVDEDGEMYIESVYLGGQKHNLVSAISKDKQLVESLPILDDGFNYRFSNLGKSYEIVRVTKVHDNGLAHFIATNNQPLTITLKGKQSVSFTLPNTQKKAIADTYLLSKYMLEVDSLQLAKGKAQSLIKYIDSKKDSSVNVKTGE